MKKVLKIGVIVAMVAMMVLFSLMPVFASEVAGGVDPSTLKGKDVTTTEMKDIGNQIITIVSVAGSIIAVIVLIVLGIKYMMGSAEEKADYKKTLLPYIIGAVFIFGASALAGIIYNFATTIGS